MRRLTKAGALSTTQDYQDYYVKLVVESAREYTIDATAGITVLGTAPQQSSPSKYYGRYVILKVNGSALETVGSAYSLSDSLPKVVTLEPATYIIHIRCDDKVTNNTSSINYNIWGEFSIGIYESNSTADSAIDYTIGTEVTAPLSITTVYKVELDASKQYVVTYTPTASSRLTIVPNPASPTSNTLANTYYVTATKEVEFTATTSGTYYVVVKNEGCKFIITEKTASTGDGDNGAATLAGKTYKNLEVSEYFEITFASGDGISGSIYLGMAPAKANFTGVLEGNTLTITLSDLAAVNGQTMTFTVGENTLTQTSANITVYGNTSSTGDVYTLSA